MRKNASKPYRRLDRSERAAIERGLDKRKSCRQIARELRRSPSTVADEVARNRTVCRGPNKGGRAAEAPDDACPKLLSWPHCCNGCRFRRYHCSRRWRCEYSAARAQALAINANINCANRANGQCHPHQRNRANRANVLSPIRPTRICSFLSGRQPDRKEPDWKRGTSWAS